jgi:hypothetical protein
VKCCIQNKTASYDKIAIQFKLGGGRLRKLNKSKVLILGVIVYLFFSLALVIIGRNVKLLTIEAKEYELKDHVNAVVSKDESTGEIFMDAYIDENTSEDFSESGNIEVVHNGTTVDGKVYKISKNSDKNLLTLKLNEQNVIKCNTSPQEFDIIYRRIDCLKIPKSSIKALDKKEGVYVVDEQKNRAVFKELKNVIKKDEESVYIDYYKNEKEKLDTVALYDRVLKKPSYINENIKIK